MKKYTSILFAFLLLFANVPLLSAQAATNEDQETSSTSIYQQRLAHPNSQNISFVAKQFNVSSTWIYNELEKGYSLVHIYEGLLQRQQGDSYDLYMQLLYPHTSESKIRVKRNPIIRGVVVGVTKLAKPYVDDAVRYAKPYVDDAVEATVSFTKNVADDVAQGAKSMYQNITQGRSVTNIKTDVPKQTFESNLQSSGWSKTTRNEINHFTKDGSRYSTRGHSNQGNPTAEYYPNGQKKPSAKIRLGD